MVDNIKTCPTCRKTSVEIKFWRGQTYCVPCQKEKQKKSWNSRTPVKRLEQHLRYKYNLSKDQFDNMWRKQLGLCSICQTTLPDVTKYEQRRRHYTVDHCHKSGRVRGLLCTSCNTLLGMAKDSKETLLRAVDYLKKMEEVDV